jgi:hypothetical protein
MEQGGPAVCVGCGRWSDWVRSRYVRHVTDEAIGGHAVRVRRRYCENPGRGKTTFAEQVDGLTVRYQRRAPGLEAVVAAVATALSGKAGARLLAHLHQALSWATLLNCLMREPDPPLPVLQVVTADDFALRRGRRNGTLVVGSESRLPIDVWDTRTADPLAAWLRTHPAIGQRPGPPVARARAQGLRGRGGPLRLSPRARTGHEHRLGPAA